MFQWLSDKTLKIVAKMIVHPHELLCHQILKCTATGFFSWQPGMFPQLSEASTVQQTELELESQKTLQTNPKHVSDSLCSLRLLTQTQYYFCQPVLHNIPASQDDNWHNILHNILQVSLSKVPEKNDIELFLKYFPTLIFF